jgi:hypothetical protein
MLAYLEVAAVALGLLFLLWLFLPSLLNLFSDSAVPSAENVSTMRAMVGNSPRQLENILPFEVPPSHFASILAALRPYQIDKRPAAWQELGELDIRCKDESRVRIQLYWTGNGPGAFQDNEGIYYRGGTDKAIEDAIRDAFKATKR